MLRKGRNIALGRPSWNKAEKAQVGMVPWESFPIPTRSMAVLGGGPTAVFYAEHRLHSGEIEQAYCSMPQSQQGETLVRTCWRGEAQVLPVRPDFLLGLCSVILCQYSSSFGSHSWACSAASSSASQWDSATVAKHLLQNETVSPSGTGRRVNGVRQMGTNGEMGTSKDRGPFIIPCFSLRHNREKPSGELYTPSTYPVRSRTRGRSVRIGNRLGADFGKSGCTGSPGRRERAGIVGHPALRCGDASLRRNRGEIWIRRFLCAKPP